MKTIFCLYTILAFSQAVPILVMKSGTPNPPNHGNLPWVMQNSLIYLENSLRENLLNTMVLELDNEPSTKIWKNYEGMMAFGPMALVEPSATMRYNRVLMPSRGPIGARGSFM